MENREKKTRSRLGKACKVISAVYMAAYGLMWLYTFSMMLNSVAFVIWSVLLQLVTAVVPGLTLWAVGVLLERQEEDRETLAEIKALLGGPENADEKEDEDLAALEERLDTALESGEEPEESAWTESSDEET